MCHTYARLTTTELRSFPRDEIVYVTTLDRADDNYTRMPSLKIPFSTSPSAKRCLFAFVGEMGAVHREIFDYETYGTKWYAEIRTSMVVETPHGLLRVEKKDKGDYEYPGFYIDHVNDNGIVAARLAMVEYIPGGESVCGYDPSNPAEMERERAEVPAERIRRVDNMPEYAYGNLEVTDGFVTRAWPNEQDNEELHFRTFHYGYKERENLPETE